MHIIRILFLVTLFGCMAACQEASAPAESAASAAPIQNLVMEKELPLDRLKLPPGFEVSVFAEVPNARSLARGSKGTIFVGNRGEDQVYAIQDRNQDGIADARYMIARGLQMPNGVAFHKGDLYVAEVSRILCYRDIENHLQNPPEPEVIYDKYPTATHHGWKFIAFGPDGKLYVPVGAPCNICNRKEAIYASITRMNPDGSGREIFVKGVRNTVGFTWHPETGDMWFTDNGRDRMGDDIPPCEVNHVTEKGQHFGYPFCHGGTIADPEFGLVRPCSDFREPALNLGAHVAPLGIRFYTGNQFPQTYQGQLFFAEHGSWDRSKKVGYQVSQARLDGDKVVDYQPFMSGWLNDDTQEVWGRPVDVLVLPDGSMLVSDDFADVVYRVVYKG